MAQLPLPAPEWMRLGHSWAGPRTCIPGPTTASAMIGRGGDPNEVLFGARILAKDSTQMAPLLVRVRQCFTNAPGMTDKTGALLATEADGVIIKVIYGLGGKEGAAVMERWYAAMLKAHGPPVVFPDSVRSWTKDTLQYTVFPPSPFWFGALTVHVRSLSGCKWLVRESETILTPGDRRLSCW